MIDIKNDYFGEVRWCEDDLKGALIDDGYPATENNIKALRNICESHKFIDNMIEAGWEYIYNAIRNDEEWDKTYNDTLVMRKLSKAEELYAYPNSSQISSQTAYIGCVKASYGKNGFIEWNRFDTQNDIEGFEEDFTRIFNQMNPEKSLLDNQSVFDDFYNNSWRLDINCAYVGARIDTKKFAYIFRLNLYPEKDEGQLQCYCYIKERLDEHIEFTKKGIRFISSDYKTLFTVPDGGRIKINYSYGETKIANCRYIDEYHFECDNNIYHICQFAEIMEMNRHTYEPIDKNN